MGLIRRFLGGPRAVTGLGEAVARTAEVFTPNATRRMALEQQARDAALAQFAAEFALPPSGRFDRLMDALNRLPRPALALGTLGLFVYAMVAPEGFALRMRGLALVPEPLWWLLGAIVGFYFGARELHYRRRPAMAATPFGGGPNPAGERRSPGAPRRSFPDNPALAEWAAQKANPR